MFPSVKHACIIQHVPLRVVAASTSFERSQQYYADKKHIQALTNVQHMTIYGDHCHSLDKSQNQWYENSGTRFGNTWFQTSDTLPEQQSEVGMVYTSTLHSIQLQVPISEQILD